MGTTTAWCSNLSSKAVATTASPNISAHSPNLRLLVMTMAQRSWQALTSWKNRLPPPEPTAR